MVFPYFFTVTFKKLKSFLFLFTFEVQKPEVLSKLYLLFPSYFNTPPTPQTGQYPVWNMRKILSGLTHIQPWVVKTLLGGTCLETRGNKYWIILYMGPSKFSIYLKILSPNNKKKRRTSLGAPVWNSNFDFEPVCWLWDFYLDSWLRLLTPTPDWKCSNFGEDDCCCYCYLLKIRLTPSLPRLWLEFWWGVIVVITYWK